MIEAPTQLLGIGIYTPAEAALYARVSPSAMKRWVYGDSRGESVLKPELRGTDERFITFLDFVQALHVRQIRQELKVPLAKIRQAIDNAEQKYDVTYPLARAHTTGLYAGELNIKLGKDRMVQISGKEAHHGLIHGIVNLYMKDLTFGPEGLAASYRAFTHGGFDIIMNPEVRFGAPLLPSCGYSARALWESARIEGSIEAAAEVNGVTPDEVEAAFRYCDSLSLSA